MFKPGDMDAVPASSLCDDEFENEIIKTLKKQVLCFQDQYKPAQNPLFWCHLTFITSLFECQPRCSCRRCRHAVNMSCRYILL